MKNICFQMSRKALVAFVAMLFCALPALAQKVTVSGTVTDSEGEPLIGASVIAQGSQTGVATDIDGRYTLTVNSNATLVFTYIGYNEVSEAVNGRTEINVTMTENSVMLGEVVAIGYGSIKKADATGAVSMVKPSEVAAGRHIGTGTARGPQPGRSGHNQRRIAGRWRQHHYPWRRITVGIQ